MAVLNHQDRWLRQAPEDLEAFFNAFTDNYGSYAEERMRARPTCSRTCQRPPGRCGAPGPRADLAHGENWEEMPFVRLEDMLWNYGEHDAYAFYMKALAERQYALYRRPHITNYRGISEDEVED